MSLGGAAADRCARLSTKVVECTPQGAVRRISWPVASALATRLGEGHDAAASWLLDQLRHHALLAGVHKEWAYPGFVDSGAEPGPGPCDGAKRRNEGAGAVIA